MVWSQTVSEAFCVNIVGEEQKNPLQEQGRKKPASFFHFAKDGNIL